MTMATSPITDAERARLFACLDGVAHAALAVSGGADSVALMELAQRWRSQSGGDAPRLTVLSVDHGLRKGSDQDAAWVAQRAQALGLACAVLRWEPGDRKTRIQADARQARYDLMADYAHANALDALVTAHHLDDQAETLLMRLGRGSGLDGLTAIPEEGRWAGLPVLRPFLDVPKARLVATLEALGLEWLEDPSNEDARFERVRVRRAMERLEALGIGAPALARSAKRLRRARTALDRITSDFLSDHGQYDPAGFCRIDASALREAPEEIGLRALARMMSAVGGRDAMPGPGKLARLGKLERLLEALKSQADPSLALSPLTLGGCRVIPGREEILVLREPGRTGLDDITLKPGECGLWDNRYHVRLAEHSSAPVRVRALGMRGYGELRVRLGRAVILPESAADGLVSFWREGGLVAVPPLGFHARSGASAGCSADLVNPGLL